MSIWRRLIAHAATSLMSSPLRSLLALLGIVIGAAAVIAMVNIGHNAKQAVLRQFDSMGAQTTTIEYQAGVQIDVASLLELRDRVHRSNPELQAVMATIQASGTLMREGKSVSAAVLGVSGNYFPLTGLALEEGRFTTDLDNGEAHAVVGRKLIDDFRKQGIYLRVGDTLLLDQTPVTLVGILEKRPQSRFSPADINNALIVPLESLRRLNRDTSRWRLLALRSKDADYRALQRQLEDDMQRLLPRTVVYIVSPEQLIQSIEQQTRILTLTLGAIGGVSLLVGGIGVMNIMLVSVSERRREIGLRMAIGARVADIKRQFLTEALILCLVGGCIGLVLGIAVAFGATRYFGETFELSMASIVLGVGVSTLVGLFFGYHPAAAAAKLDPVDTLYGD